MKPRAAARFLTNKNRQGNVISAKGEMQEVQPAEYLVLIDDSESTIQNIGIRKSPIHMFLYSHLGGSLYLHPSEDTKKEMREKLAHMIEKELNEWRKLVAIRKEVSHYVVQPRPTPKEKCSISDPHYCTTSSVALMDHRALFYHPVPQRRALPSMAHASPPLLKYSPPDHHTNPALACIGLGPREEPGTPHKQ